jgi:hypothetical protein
MIDTPIVRMHQHGACIEDIIGRIWVAHEMNLTSKIHAVVYTNSPSVRLPLAPGEHMTIACVGSPQRLASANDAAQR